MGARRWLNCTQIEWVRRGLLSGKTLAHPDLVKVCGGRSGWRLAAIVYKLRAAGWPIESRLMPNPRTATNPNPPVAYQLPAGWRPGDSVQLEFSL